MSTNGLDRGSSGTVAAAYYNSGGSPWASGGGASERLLIGRGSGARRMPGHSANAWRPGDRENALLLQPGLEQQLFESPAGSGSLREIEETSGYGTVKNKTFELLEEISQKKVMHQESLRSVCADLSKRLEVTLPSTILSLINALAPVDEYLQRHCVNVGLLNGLIGTWLGMGKQEIDDLVLIGLLHDFGKMMIPSRVLMAPRKLTNIEFEVIKMHPVNSYDLLSEFPESLRRAARSHHEKVSGAGYPDGLLNEDIPLGGRITAISDIYDSMVSRRAYKGPISPFSILATLTRMKHTDLDAGLVEVFIAHMPLELYDKPVLMSDGTIGLVRSFDPDDPERPMIEVNGRVIQSSDELHCVSMYTGS